jgi:hypothetical protein
LECKNLDKKSIESKILASKSQSVENIDWRVDLTSELIYFIFYDEYVNTYVIRNLMTGEAATLESQVELCAE